MKKLSIYLKLWAPALTFISIAAMLIVTFVSFSPYGSYSKSSYELPPPYIITSGGNHAYVDINSLSAYIISCLPYIGAYADDIVSLRSELGGFVSLEELMLVDGIGILSYQNVRVMLMIKEFN